MNKILVVDDSALMRRHLSGILKSAGYEVATAANGAEGVERVMTWQPDAVTLDVNMPEMDGLTALSLMMSARPTPVIMVSSLTEKGAMATLEALALGAVDYLAKPGGTISLSIEEVEAQLLSKVRAAIRARPRTREQTSANETTPTLTRHIHRHHAPNTSLHARRAHAELDKVAITQAQQKRQVDSAHAVHACPLVLIGVSTGGPRTLEDILPALPADFAAAVLIAQHMPPTFTEALAQRMDRLCPMPVREVSCAMAIEPGHVYIGKGGMDLHVIQRLGRPYLSPRPESPDHLWHPSVDVMVETAMKVYRPDQLIGVLLTGMGNDGAQAMHQLHQAGGQTIAESEATAVVFGMPQELIERRGATTILPSTDIAAQLINWLA